MKFISKLGVVLLTLAFIIQPFHSPIYALTTDIDAETMTAIIKADETNEDSVPLFQEPSESSKIVKQLAIEDEVLVLEETDEFFFVRYIEVNDTEEVWEGFISKQFLDFEDQQGIIENENEQGDGQSSESESDNTSNKEEASKSTEEKSEEQLVDSEEATETEVEEDTETVVDEELSEAVDSDEEQTSEAKTEVNQSAVKKSDISTFAVKSASLASQKTYNGVALKNPTYVYKAQSTDSERLRSYDQGTVLKYKSLNTNWYEATVLVNGKWTTGYIHNNDVENAFDTQELLSGIGINNPTTVYARASTSSNTLKSYNQGSILKYRTFSANWYEATVYIKGKATTGYIHKSHVENSTSNQETLNGIGRNNPTNIYSSASTGSKVLRSYAQGSILKYRTFTNNWYQATVYINGKKTTGYIHKNHVENSVANQTSLKGIGTQSPTTVYASASTSSGKLRSYAQGSILLYKTFSSNWYEATVYINGKRTTGYIHKNHVENAIANQETLEGWADKQPTNVYSSASKSSEVLRGYTRYSNLKFKTFTSSWYEATVYISGEPKTGYIHVDDVHFGFDINYTSYNLSLEQALAIQMRATPQTDQKYGWVSKDYIDKNNKVTASSLNVRSEPVVKSNNSLGTIPNGTVVTIMDEHNGWYAIAYHHNVQWVHAGPSDVQYYLNPENFVNNEVQMFQFLDLSKPSGSTERVLNNFLADKGILAGQGRAFIDAGRTNNINDVYLISHALLETGHGRSQLANGVRVGLDRNNRPTMVTESNQNSLTQIKIVYNMFGIQAFDSCPLVCGSQHAYEMGWTSPYLAIVGGAQFIGNNYIKGENSTNTVQNTIYKMRWNPEYMGLKNNFGHQYATDVGWASKQINTMYNLYRELDSYVLALDVPIYK